MRMVHFAEIPLIAKYPPKQKQRKENITGESNQITCPVTPVAPGRALPSNMACVEIYAIVMLINVPAIAERKNHIAAFKWYKFIANAVLLSMFPRNVSSTINAPEFSVIRKR